MSYEIHKNTFEGGVDKSSSYQAIESNKALESRNLLFSDLYDNNKFTALENIKGTTSLETLYAGTGGNALAIYINNYTIGTEQNVRCATIFSINAAADFTIQAYRLDTGVLYDLYSKSVPVDWITLDRTIDGVSYAEFGQDVIYFTDNYYPVQKLVCNIPLPYVANYLGDLDLSLPARAAIGTVDYVDTALGGTLLTGTYQLAYQLLNLETNRQTRFSLLTTPIQVSAQLDTGRFAGIGLPSGKEIVFNIVPTTEELAYYTHFRVAVVENIHPSGVVNSAVGLTPIEEIADYLSGSTIFQYEIKSNTQYTSALIDEIVIDLAAIERVNTLTVKEQRLLLGNVTLKDLDYDNGTPEIGGGSVLSFTNAVGTKDSFSSDNFTTKFKGYFRGEVYRFGISYFDEYGNYSYPVTLDLSSVTENNITSGLIDMKFFGRDRGSTTYTLMSTVDQTKSIGLQLSDITNHPTWARGFIIVRAKRKKNLLFQSPFLPMANFAGIGAVANYPTTAEESSGSVNYPDAVPMGPSNVFMPYNMFLGAFAQAHTTVSASTGAGTTGRIQAGESIGLIYSNNYSHGLLYPPINMYENTPYVFTGSEQLSTVDAAICRLYATRFDSNVNDPGEVLETSISGTFFASLNDDYYFNAGGGVKAPIRSVDDNMTISDSKPFDNFSAGTMVGGTSAWDNTKLETKGITLGFPANTQRSVVAAMSYARTPLGGPVGINPSFDSGTPVYAPESSNILDDNAYLVNSTGLFGSYANTVEIVNVVATTSPYMDGRYGDAEDFNEFIFTGTKVVFTPVELALVEVGTPVLKTVDVWGGDCIVSPHTFKISDTAYSIINQEKAKGGSSGTVTATLVDNWTKVWENDQGAPIMMPVPVKNASQYITVVLESEYHGSIRDIDTYTTVGTYNFAIKGCTSENMSRAPLTYAYNINLNKQNDQKIFVPKDPLNILPNSLPARIYYSDIKIYQSSIPGFDTVRVLNYIDLPESQGALTKLAINADSVIAVQEDGISYIPVGEKILEETDSSQIAVRSGEFLGVPLVIDSKRGGQHVGAVLEIGNELFIFDNRRKDLYKLSGTRELGSITETMRPFFFSEYAIQQPKSGVKLWYDYNRFHVWVSNLSGDMVPIYNNKYGLWESDGFEFPNQPDVGVSSNTTDDLLIIGHGAANTELYSMYTGTRTSLFGTDVTPKVVFSVNPNFDIGKVFDAMLITASNPITVSMSTKYPGSGVDQSMPSVTPIGTRGEGNYKVKSIRDTVVNPGARMRGTSAQVTVTWPTDDAPQTLVNSVLTQYRPSAKIF